MFSIVSPNERDNLVLVFDIQSGIINGALALIKPDRSLKLLNVKSREIIRRGHLDSRGFIESMLGSLSALTRELSDNHHIKQAHIILSSPWIISQSKLTKVKFDKETVVTSKLIDEIIEEGSDSNNFDNDAIYIEKKIFDIKLNGYSVSKYIDRPTLNLDVSFVSTISSNTLLNAIRDNIKKPFKIPRIDYHSSLLLNFVSLRKLVTDMNDYIYVHVHAEMTDLIIVKNGLCAHIASFPLGISSLIKNISTALNVDSRIAESMLSMNKDGKLDDAEKAKIYSKLDEYSNIWLNNYSEAIKSSVDKDLLPEIMYISALSHVDIYKNLIKSKVSENIHFIDLDVDTMVVHTLALSDML